MHFHDVFFFGAVALLASSDAQLHSNSFNLTSLEPNGNPFVHLNEAQSGQRVEDGDLVDADDDDEEDERMFNFKGFSGIEKLQQFLQPKVTLGKLNTWISQEKSPDYVFMRFGFHKPGKEHFNNPDFNVWAAYTKRVIQHEPEKAMLATLRKYHTEDELMRNLVAAKEGDATNTIFSGLYAKWITQGKTPLDVSKTLGLHGAESEDLNHGAATRWVSYVDEFFKVQEKNSNSIAKYDPKEMLRMLKTYYPKDKLVGMLANARKTADTDEMFSKLYAEWRSDEKTSLDVFKTFGLHEAKTVDAKRASFARWLDFINTQSKEQGNSGLILLTAVTGHISYSDLTQLLGQGKTEAVQMLPFYWKKKGLGGAFKVASLKGDGELLASAGFQAWLKFMGGYNKANVLQKASVFETMERFFGEKKLTAVLIAGSKDPKSTELSIGLLSEQVTRWTANTLPPEDLKHSEYTTATVFKMLQLDGDKNVITNPVFSLWCKYAYFTSQESSIIKVLLRNYDSDALIKMILEAKTTKGSELSVNSLETRLFAHWVELANAYGMDRDTFARLVFKLGPPTKDGKPNPLQDMYDDFMVFKKTQTNLKVGAEGTTSDTVLKKLEDAALLNEKIAKAKEKLEKEQKAAAGVKGELKEGEEAAEVEVPPKTRKTLRDFLMEPQ